MANEEHLKFLKQGPHPWTEWRKNNREVKPDLSGASLVEWELGGINLSRVNFTGANLSMANMTASSIRYSNLRYAKLFGAKLVDADLTCADLNEADLRFAVISDANLHQTTLIKAGLMNAILTGADLRDADFSQAKIGWTTFGNNDLSSMIGLDTIEHIGPSTIGIDTICKSGGNIPDVFLHGCGVPDDFITFIPSIIGAKEVIQFYSCFISYSTKDAEFATCLYSRLRDEHLRVWFAPEDVKGGQKLHEQIERAIQRHDRLLLILSENSMQSEWVITEIRNAHRVKVGEKRRKLFPIRLVDFDTIQKWKCFDADTGKDLAVELREYFIPDFSNWKHHESFEKAFERLLRDLRAEESHKKRA